MWYCCGIHCRGLWPRMDDRLHASCISMCTCVCVQPAQWGSGWSLHLINKSVKKRSIVCRTVQTMFSDLEVRPTLNSETKYSSLNCPNPVKNRLNRHTIHMCWMKLMSFVDVLKTFRQQINPKQNSVQLLMWSQFQHKVGKDQLTKFTRYDCC